MKGTASSRHRDGSEPAGWKHDAFEASPLRPRPACGRGGRDPRRPQSVEAAPLSRGWRPVLAV